MPSDTRRRRRPSRGRRHRRRSHTRPSHRHPIPIQMGRFLVSSIVVVAFAGSAAAEPRRMTSAAKAEFDRGLELFAAHDYAGTIAALDAGYAIAPPPDFLNTKAQAQRLGGDCRGALVTYNAFLATSPPPREAKVARDNVAKCEKLLAASTTSPEPEPKPEPNAEPLPTPRAPERDRVEPIEQPAWYSDRTGLILAGGGVLALGVATVFVFRAQASADDAQNASLLGEWTAAHSAWVADRIVVGVSAGVGAALLIGAGYRFWTANHVDRVVARPTANGQGAVLSLEGRW